MTGLVVVVPTRGRPEAAAELAGAFTATRTADSVLLLAVDGTDPLLEAYLGVVDGLDVPWVRMVVAPSTTMGEALRLAVAWLLESDDPPAAIGFMGDDHRPRGEGWDRAYLNALSARPGIVYGDDLVQGEALPTQCAMSTSVVRALGHMAPPVLEHLYLDNYWLALGRAADCIAYLPGVVVEHVHPVTGRVPWDDGHVRVNSPALYQRDRAAFEAYWAEHGDRDVCAVRAALAAVTT